MNYMKCSACGKPIVGYWVTIKKMGDNRNFCVPCAQSTSIWDLVVEGVFGIQPDIAIEIDGDKQRLSSAYDMFVDEEDEDKPRFISSSDLFADENTDSAPGNMDVKFSYPANFVEKIATDKEGTEDT